MKQFGIILIITLFFSCQNTRQPSHIHFYHWQSIWDVSDEEWTYINHQSDETPLLYVRYFDIAWQAGEAVPGGRRLVLKVRNRNGSRNSRVVNVSERLRCGSGPVHWC